MKWEGQEDWDEGAGRYVSRCVILGANAVQSAWGMMPDYRVEMFDFNKRSESAVLWWMNQHKTRYVPKLGGDYVDSRVSNMDTGCIYLDVQTGSKS